jgi:Na+/H+-dicarboxylate symporter
MPTISIFFGIIVQMYWRDHAPPHVHAFYQGQEALFAIRDGKIIAGNIPPVAVKLMRTWIAKNRAELLLNWDRGTLREPFEKIAGLDNP